MTVESFAAAFERLERSAFDEEAATRAFDAILSGGWNSTQIAAFAAALRLRGHSAEVLTAAARALRSVMSVVDHGLPEVLDTCGTGGDGAHTLNVSTAAAIVAASCGAHVAKHGNRSVSSRCGSADVVEALGIPIDVEPSRHPTVLREARITFMMAPRHHPALRHAAEARRELGIRTVFNALGPLVNPANATHQLVGVYEDALRPVVASVLATLGVRRAWVVRSEDGLDEISPFARTRVTALEGGALREIVVTPSSFGAEPTAIEALAGGTAEDNARVIAAVLDGEPRPAATAIAMNAGAALHVLTGRELARCYADAAQSLLDGRARATLERWRASANAQRGSG